MHKPADFPLGFMDQMCNLPKHVPLACFIQREGIPATLLNQEIAFSGQGTSCCLFGGWTFLSVLSLGLCQKSRKTNSVWVLLGKTACSQVTTVMHTHGVQTAAVDTVDGLYPREMRRFTADGSRRYGLIHTSRN